MPPAQSLPPLYRTARFQVTRLGKNDSIGQPLVVSFAMIVRHEISNGRLERRLSKQNHSVQAGLLDASHKSLRVRVQIRTPRRQSDRLYADALENRQKLCCVQRV